MCIKADIWDHVNLDKWMFEVLEHFTLTGLFWEHWSRRYCRWQPTFDSRVNMDHHFEVPDSGNRNWSGTYILFMLCLQILFNKCISFVQIQVYLYKYWTWSVIELKFTFYKKTLISNELRHCPSLHQFLDSACQLNMQDINWFPDNWVLVSWS